MTIQLSDCCKATIDLDKTKKRPECYTCSKCGRIIGSPLPQPTMNQIPNIEEMFRRTCPVHYNRPLPETCDKCCLAKDWKQTLHQQLQKAREEERERIEQKIPFYNLNQMCLKLAKIAPAYGLSLASDIASIYKALDHSELDQDKK